MRNRQWRLAARPVGEPKNSDFTCAEADIPTMGPGDALLEVVYLSVDPYMRGRMNDAKSYAAPMQIGDVMVGGTVARVIECNGPELRPGDFVEAYLGWQEYAVAPAKRLRKLDAAAAPIATALGVLGMPGLTAYFGLTEICQPKPGETLVVSGAGGAVGSYVGQMAKAMTDGACRVVGTAGSDAKIAWITDELGFDAAINYKAEGSVYPALKQACPQGVDCYFDNTGGPVTDAAFGLLNPFSRVAVCGQISQYNNTQIELGPRPFLKILSMRVTVRGFIVSDFFDRAEPARAAIAQWIRDGKLRYRNTIVDGFENAPAAFLGVLRGENTGKMLVRVKPE